VLPYDPLVIAVGAAV